MRALQSVYTGFGRDDTAEGTWRELNAVPMDDKFTFASLLYLFLFISLIRIHSDCILIWKQSKEA